MRIFIVFVPRKMVKHFFPLFLGVPTFVRTSCHLWLPHQSAQEEELEPKELVQAAGHDVESSEASRSLALEEAFGVSWAGPQKRRCQVGTTAPSSGKLFRIFQEVQEIRNVWPRLNLMLGTFIAILLSLV